MRGAVETSSQPSAPAPLIQASRPLNIPCSLALKMTILSKYSHCIISLLPLRSRTQGFSRRREVIGKPTADGLAGRAVEADVTMIEPARKEANETVFVLQVRADVLGDEALFGQRKLGL